MTVSELIAKLQEMPQDLLVSCNHDEDTDLIIKVVGFDKHKYVFIRHDYEALRGMENYNE